VIVRRVAADCIEDTGGFFVTTPIDDPAYADRFAGGCGKTGVPCEEIEPAQEDRRVGGACRTRNPVAVAVAALVTVWSGIDYFVRLS
jgi:siroheme synthase (precorrin-2 oxidase/ferrochelatase)